MKASPTVRCVTGIAGLLLLLAPDAAFCQKSGGEAESKPSSGDSPAAASKDAGSPAAALRSGDYAEAMEGYRRVLASDTSSAEGARGLAEALASTGKLDEALATLQASPIFGKTPALLVAAGRLHLRRGALAEAEKSFRAALELDKDQIEALNRLGETCAKRGQVDEAKKLWNRLVSIYQDMSAQDAENCSAETFVEMGLALVGLNRFKEANDVMFSSARDKDPKNPSLLLESGRIFLAKYNYPDSRDYLKEAIDQNRKFADALVALADNYMTDFQVGTKRYELAAKYLDEALKVNPNHAEAYLVKGVLELSDGNVGAAAGHFRKSIELDPSSLRARGCLAACHLLNADEDALKKASEDALAVDPKGAEFFHTIAASVEGKFRYKDAVRFSDRALELDPDYWPAYVTLGINCLRTGEEARGRSFLDKSWEHDKFNVWVFNTRTLLKHMDANYRELKTDRFVFKFPKKDYEELRLYLVPLLEDAYVKLSAHYKTEIPSPVYVEVFSEHKWFSARTVGLEGFAASGACFGNLVTLTTPKALPQNWGAVAWHEFAHVVALALTKHRVPRWLTEGLSVFEEGRDHPRWARGFERDIADNFASGRLLPIGELDYGFSKPKYPNQILISYFQGCLIATYIKEKWSFDSILAILKGYGDNKGTAQIFQEVLGQSLEEFDRGFFEYVAKWVAANGYEPTVAPERIPALKLAVEEDPKDVKRHVDLAWAYLTSDNEVDAPIEAQRALEIEPQNGDAHAILGLDAYRQKSFPKAKEELGKALDAGTRFRYRCYSALGAMAQKDGNKEEAVANFEKAREASPRAGAGYPPGRNLYYVLHDLYKELGKDDDAVQRMEELSAFSVEDPKCRQRIVNHYVKLDGEEAARKARLALDELLFLNPFDRGTHDLLARVAEKAGEHVVTIREYTYLLQFPETNPKVAYLALAKAHAALGEKEKAVEFARKILGIDEDNAEAKHILEKFSAQ